MPNWKHTEQSPGEYLHKRFLEPLKISASQLARATGMPRSRVSELVSGQRRITADTAMRLGAFLGMEPEFWMALQASWDLAHIQVDMTH
ncbi:MAG: HigA family addiction module antitoxin, partial [Myxococcota bacterium]